MTVLKFIVRLLASVIGGALIALLITWCFQFEIADISSWKRFPADWTLYQLIVNSFVIMSFIGGTKATFTILRMEASLLKRIWDYLIHLRLFN